MRIAVVLLAVTVVPGCLLMGCKPQEEESAAVTPPIMKTEKAPTPPTSEPAEPEDSAQAAVKCLVCGMEMDPESEMALRVECDSTDQECYVCAGACEEEFLADTSKYCPADEGCVGGVCTIIRPGKASDEATEEAPAEADDDATEGPSAE